MALIQLNINRLGQGWFILWEEAELGGSLGVYQADGWTEGWTWMDVGQHMWACDGAWGLRG